MLPRRITPYTNTYPTLGELTPILPGLYLSSLRALQAHLAHPNDITHVLSILDFPTELAFSGTRLEITLADDPKADLLSRLDECVRFVQGARNEGAVVVHCLMGLSRSVCIVVGCVMVDMDMGVEEAVEFVRSKRGTIRPNAGFIKQLEVWSRLKSRPVRSRWSWLLGR